MSTKKRSGKSKRHLSMNQSTLLDDSGTPHFRFDTDVRMIAGASGKFQIAGMSVVLLPAPKDEPSAVGVVVDCLRVLWTTLCDLRRSGGTRVHPIELDIWNNYSCTATFRNCPDEGDVRAVLVAHSRIELSLPHSTSWHANGLAWLSSFANCCSRNRSNPTPWLGAACDCPIREHY
jgi:hypothetical protein